MANANPKGKKVLIDKTNSLVVGVTSVAVFIVVFSLIASKLLLSQLGYQTRITKAKSTALSQLKSDVSAAHQLIQSYQDFIAKQPNIIGGNSIGCGQQDGNDAKIVLDSLPSSYDFPALATTLQKILSGQTTQNPPVIVQITSITGNDQEATLGVQNTSNSSNSNSSTSTSSCTTAPSSASASNTNTANASSGAAVPMPFEVSVTGNYSNIQNLITVFERSIRPFQVQSISLNGGQNNMTMDVTAQTYYLPATSFKLNSKVVK